MSGKRLSSENNDNESRSIVHNSKRSSKDPSVQSLRKLPLLMAQFKKEKVQTEYE